MTSSRGFRRDLCLLSLLVLELLSRAPHVQGYPSGAGEQACPSESPQICHKSTPQKTPSPYSIIVKEKTYSPGLNITVTLETATGSPPFLGFLLGVHRVQGNTTEYLGSFSASDNVQPRCGANGNTGATQTHPDNKTLLTTEWSPPATAEGELVVTGAFIQRFDTYWVNVTSDTLSPVNYTTSAPFITSASTNQPTSLSFLKDSECGKTKSCYGNCLDDGNCTLLTTWEKANQSLIITIRSVFTASDDVWASVGFGSQAKMINASVTDCVVHASEVRMFTSFNDQHHGNAFVSPDNATGLSNMEGTFKDGILSCTVHRALAATQKDVFNLASGLYHVLLARGQTDGWIKQMHELSDDFVTADSYDLNTVIDLTAHSPDMALVKLHGCFMTIAWIFFASTGVLVARFYKPAWPGQKVCGVQVWFAIHRATMIATFIASAAGFIIIFIHVNGLSQIVGMDYKKAAHPILGIIVMALTVINPVMSLFRCSPNHEYRPIFNWAHRLVGCSAYVLGVVTVAIGTQLTEGLKDDVYLVIAFGVWLVLAHTVLEVNKFLERRTAMSTKVYQDLQSSFKKVDVSGIEVYRYIREIIFSLHLMLTFSPQVYRYIREIIFSLHLMLALAACVTIFRELL